MLGKTYYRYSKKSPKAILAIVWLANLFASSEPQQSSFVSGLSFLCLHSQTDRYTKQPNTLMIHDNSRSISARLNDRSLSSSCKGLFAVIGNRSLWHWLSNFSSKQDIDQTFKEHVDVSHMLVWTESFESGGVSPPKLEYLFLFVRTSFRPWAWWAGVAAGAMTFFSTVPKINVENEFQPSCFTHFQQKKNQWQPEI